MPGLEESITHNTSVPSTRALMSDGDHTVNEKVKKFIFTSRRALNNTKDDNKERLEILIPEVRKQFARKHGNTYSMIEQFLSNVCYVLVKVRSLLFGKCQSDESRNNYLLIKFFCALHIFVFFVCLFVFIFPYFYLYDRSSSMSWDVSVFHINTHLFVYLY